MFDHFNQMMQQLGLLSLLTYILTCVLTLGARGDNPIAMSILRHDAPVLPCRVDPSTSQTSNLNVEWYRKTSGSNTEVRITFGKLGLIKKITVNKDDPYEWNLVIDRIDETDEGIYTCKWTSPFRMETVIVYDITVDSPAKVDEDASSPRQMTFREGDTVNLTCTMTGKPKPEITWFRQHRADISRYEPIGVSGSVLTIPEVPRYAGDIYACKGRNRHHTAWWEIDLKVRFKPRLYVHQPIITARPSTSVNMTCMVEASTKVTWQWYDIYGNKIKPTYKYHLVDPERLEGYPVEISTLSLRQSFWDSRDYGAYKCQATTKNHKVQGDIYLRDSSRKHKHNG